MKRVLHACLDQHLHFDLWEEYIAFLAVMDRGRKKYKVVSTAEHEDGSVTVHIRRQYNNASFAPYEE